MSEAHAPDGRVWYIAGPMSHIPQFNYPLFDRAANALRNSGYKVRSPAEMDDEHVRAAALASPDGDLRVFNDSLQKHGHEPETWGDFLSRDVKLIADECDGIIFLPGWHNSRGARLEAYVALTCGHPFMGLDFFENQMLLSDMSPAMVKTEIFKNV